jgi:hypothetical protein
MENVPIKILVFVDDGDGGKGVWKACLGLARWEGA